MKRVASTSATRVAITVALSKPAPACSPSHSVATTSNAAKLACTAQTLSTDDNADSWISLRAACCCWATACSRKRHYQGQQRQADQGNQAQAQVDQQQRNEDHQRRHHSGEQRREHMGRQLRDLHHALGGDMAQARGVGGIEPAHRQRADMLAQALAATAQHGNAHGDAGLLHPAPQVPAHHHAQGQQGQPLAGGFQLVAQQVTQDRHQGDDGQPAQHAIHQREADVAAQEHGVVAEQSNESPQHDQCSSTCAVARVFA
ncbi:hypothetical protein WR25_03036 [Diploscapter pachys]|uniref:Uncharacterized protein n=1 Tax=Diploscapter pachys TaxID=2018661 RepID=A0A2A2K2E6_9BILA|nr:hypothetical protein WR25_03036 [Diploscapter pachys]